MCYHKGYHIVFGLKEATDFTVLVSIGYLGYSFGLKLPVIFKGTNMSTINFIFST